MRSLALALVLLTVLPAYARQTFGTLTVVQAEPVPAGPSPLSAQTAAEWRFVELVYAPLYAQGSKGYTPWLGQKVTVESGGKRLVVSLAEEAKWSVGRDITPLDVVYTYEMARSGKWNRAYVALLSTVTSVRRSDDGFDIVLELSRPAPNPEALLTVPIVPNGLHGPLDDESRQRPLPLGVVGAGMYKLASPQDTSRLVANEHSKRAPRISEVRFLASGDPSASIDIVRLLGDAITFDTTPEAASIAGREFPGASLKLDTHGVVMVVLGSSTSLWNDATVIKAARQALDRRELFSLGDGGRPSTVPVPKRHPAYPPGITLPTRDAAAARTTLEGAGWAREFGIDIYNRKGDVGESERLELPLLVDGDDRTMLRRAAILRRRLWEAGIDLRVDTRPRLELLSRVASREFPAALVAMEGDLTALFHSKGAWNVSGFQDETVDTALESGKLGAAVKGIMERARAIVLGTEQRGGIRGRNVMAPKVTGRGGFADFHKWRIQ